MGNGLGDASSSFASAAACSTLSDVTEAEAARRRGLRQLLEDDLRLLAETGLMPDPGLGCASAPQCPLRAERLAGARECVDRDAVAVLCLPVVARPWLTLGVGYIVGR